jgi:hypothetical protein
VDRIESLASERQRHWSRMAALLRDASRRPDAKRDHGVLADRVHLITAELNGHAGELLGRKPRAGEFGAYGQRRQTRRATA